MSTAPLPDSTTIVRDAIRKVSSIATLPEITTQVISTVENPNSTAKQLHQIISHDPALVTRILKVVNSAFYGLPGQIGSIERAIVLLGLNAVKNIAIAASLGQLFRGAALCDGYSPRDLWTHCIAVAITARALAREMKLPIADEAFLAGMIHDLGMIVSLQVHPDKLREVCQKAHQDGGDFCAIEQELIGTDHAQLGMALAEAWKFPRPCQLVAGYHHRPTDLADNNRILVTLVAVADVLCCQGGQGFHLTAQHQNLAEMGADQIQLDPAAIERVKTALPQLVGQTQTLFAAA
ncbi:MAG: HDOD domain-containing protein [Phycisphaerales bacterium]|jgi:putative nucleotidyltransferase with HDIG domain|nr:HDOD domain-containing protein [Phycisphaerales bacterium]